MQQEAGFGCKLSWLNVLALALPLLLCSPLLAQVDVTARLVGTVTDPSGAVVPGAQLLARNQQTALELKATTDDKGDFNFPSVPPGAYTISCEVQGFKKFVSTDVVVTSQRTYTLPVVLQVGTTTQTIEVSAAAAMVDTVTATVQSTYDEKLMATLPVYGRDARVVLERLLPGSVDAGTGASYDVKVTSFNGVSGLSNNYRIDGSDTNDYFHGSATPMPAVENLAEFTVATSLPDASFGRGAGAQITAVMKSGANTPHGQVWGVFQNAAWNANRWENNWRGIPRQSGSQQWYGGNAGGPVFIPKLYNGKNKTFFFTSYERTSVSLNATSTGRTISDAERAGDFSNSPSGIPIIDGVPTPIIDPADFSPLGKFMAEHTDVLPHPTSGVDTFTWNPSRSSLTQSFIGRIDHNFSEKHRLFGSLWWYRDVPSFDDMFFMFGQAGWGSHYPNPKVQWSMPKKIQSWTFNDTYTISPTMVNNFILGVKRLMITVGNTYDPANALFSGKDVGVGAVGDVRAPDVQYVTNWSRTLGFGSYNGYIDDMTQNSVYFADNFSVTRGRHTWKMGVEVRKYHELKYQTWGAGAGIDFGDWNLGLGGGTGNGYADMLLGRGASFSQNNTQILNVYYPAREAYLQDTFRATSRLTFMFGARWQPHFGVRPAAGNFVTFRPGQASTVFPTAPLGLVSVGDQGVPANLYGNRYGDIGPRASLAWDIFGNGKASFRAGYAWMTDYQVLIGYNEYCNTAPYGIYYSPNMETLDLANPYTEYGTVPFPFKAPLAGDPNNTKIVFPKPVNTVAYDKDYNSAQIHQWNATFDFEPIKTYLISVGYVATRGTHLSNSRDLNWPRFVPGESTNITDNIRSRRPYYDNGFETIRMYFADFNSMYNSLQVRFNKRYSRGLTLMGHYTMSRNTTQNGTRLFDNQKLDYYSPGTDHHFALAYAYDLPIPKGKTRASKAILGGWTLGGTVQAQSGGWFGVGDYNCNEFNFASTGGCAANFVGGDPYSTMKGNPMTDASGAPVGVYWAEASKFIRPQEILVDGVAVVSPEVGQRLFIGNAITGTIKGPAAFMMDASLRKKFAFSETLSLDFRLDAMNVLNHTVLNGPGSLTTGGDMTHFGVIDSAWDPRRLQLSVQFVF
jgi:hypothetical protein